MIGVGLLPHVTSMFVNGKGIGYKVEFACSLIEAAVPVNSIFTVCLSTRNQLEVCSV